MRRKRTEKREKLSTFGFNFWKVLTAIQEDSLLEATKHLSRNEEAKEFGRFWKVTYIWTGGSTVKGWLCQIGDRNYKKISSILRCDFLMTLLK